MRKEFRKQKTENYLGVILGLSIVQIFISLAIIITIETFKLSPLKYVSISKSEMQVQFFCVTIFAVLLLIANLWAIFAFRKAASDPLSSLASVLLVTLNFFVLITIIACIIVLGMIFVTQDLLENIMETSLLRGINDYHLDPEWRLTWDHLQFHEECCGVHGYKDWEDSVYVEDMTTECNTTAADELFMTPFSCCKKNSKCLESFIPQKSATQTLVEVPPIKLAQINPAGCFNVIKSSLRSLVFTLFVELMLMVLIEIIIIILTRILLIKSTTCCYLRKAETEYHNEVVTVTQQEVNLEPANMNSDSCNTEFENEDSGRCTCRNHRRRPACDDDAHLPLLIH